MSQWDDCPFSCKYDSIPLASVTQPQYHRPFLPLSCMFLTWLGKPVCPFMLVFEARCVLVKRGVGLIGGSRWRNLEARRSCNSGGLMVWAHGSSGSTIHPPAFISVAF